MPRKPTSRVELRSQDEAVIVRFTDAIWLEDGLGEKTRQAYRSDLERLAAWLQEQPGTPLLTEVRRTDLLGWISRGLSDGFKTSTAARRLSGLRRFFRYLLREGVIAEDPTLRIDSPRLPRRLPDSLSEETWKTCCRNPILKCPLSFATRR